jgi:hypothetical protein
MMFSLLLATTETATGLPALLIILAIIADRAKV